MMVESSLHASFFNYMSTFRVAAVQLKTIQPEGWFGGASLQISLKVVKEFEVNKI